jgi:DNA-3-methyladenine glycosylase I
MQKRPLVHRMGGFLYGQLMEVVTGPDGVPRCAWGASTPDYLPYHDQEWGYPAADDATLFQKLCLESFQSGLAWITVLRKREAFRRAFHNFDPASVAAMGPEDVERLLGDASIIRHRGKIEAAIHNAKSTLALQESQSLASFVWAFEPSESSPLAAETPESRALAKALKGRGYVWLGPTTVYAFMQAMGLVNDHLEDCAFRNKAVTKRIAFRKP